MEAHRFSGWRSVITLFLALTVALGVRPAARERQQINPQHPRYELIDLGDFGGPQSYLNVNAKVLSDSGVVAGFADTLMSDPFPSACFNLDCFVSHAFQWRKGVLTDLGALAPGWSSAAFWESDTGLIVGISENGVIDPLTGLPELHGVLWKDGRIIDLGTLGGNESLALAVNNVGQVVGFSANTVADPFSLAGFGTQTRAFLWHNGVMQDLNTLGGPDAAAVALNEYGQVAGFSYTSSTPGSAGVPQIDPFRWQIGKMTDLGSLGGPAGMPIAINNSGQVVGQMDPPGNYKGFQLFHPFLWDEGVLTDLGTFYPPLGFGTASWINDRGDVVGFSDNIIFDFPFLWKDGVKTDLGDVAGDTCAYALGINLSGQTVGRSGPCGSFAHAFLWERGGPILDLNTLIVSANGVQVTNAFFINERREIAALGLLPDGNQHAFLMVPCGEGDAECENSAAAADGLTQNNPTSFARRLSASAAGHSASGGGGLLERLNAWKIHGRPIRALRGTPLK